MLTKMMAIAAATRAVATAAVAHQPLTCTHTTPILLPLLYYHSF